MMVSMCTFTEVEKSKKTEGGFKTMSDFLKKTIKTHKKGQEVVAEEFMDLIAKEIISLPDIKIEVKDPLGNPIDSVNDFGKFCAEQNNIKYKIVCIIRKLYYAGVEDGETLEKIRERMSWDLDMRNQDTKGR